MTSHGYQTGTKSRRHAGKCTDGESFHYFGTQGTLIGEILSASERLMNVDEAEA